MDQVKIKKAKFGMRSELRIVLVGSAKEAHDRMLESARDGKTRINSSQLINWIVCDYFSRYFDKRKEAICKAHFNERKFVLDAMKIEDPTLRREALQSALSSLISKRQHAEIEGGTKATAQEVVLNAGAEHQRSDID